MFAISERFLGKVSGFRVSWEQRKRFREWH